MKTISGSTSFNIWYAARRQFHELLLASRVEAGYVHFIPQFIILEPPFVAQRNGSHIVPPILDIARLGGIARKIIGWLIRPRRSPGGSEAKIQHEVDPGLLSQITYLSSL